MKILEYITLVTFLAIGSCLVVTEISPNGLGVYTRGDMFTSHSVALLPFNIYLSDEHFCTGDMSSSGFFTVDDDILTLNSERLDSFTSTYEMNKFYLVPWHNSIFMVWKPGIIDFCNDINSNVINTSIYLSVMEKHSFIYHEKPELPKQFRNYILDSMVVAWVMDIDPFDYTVQINRGSESGLLPGMKLYPEGQVSSYAFYEIVDVQSEHAVLVPGESGINVQRLKKMSSPISSHLTEEFLSLKKGDVLCTRLGYRRQEGMQSNEQKGDGT